jgi:hypothetical protein
MNDRIPYHQLSQLTGGRDRPAAHAIDNAARGVNATEHAIRQLTGMIRAQLTDIEQRLDHGLSLNDLGELQRMPADLDRAITLRQHHWQVLGALLTETEITSLQPAARPPAARETALADTKIVIRDIHIYGDDLTVPEAIARLCAGGPVTVTLTDPAPPGGDPRGNPRPGYSIEVSPARTTSEPAQPRVNWAGNARPAEDAAWNADALMLASQLATWASLGSAALGHAAAIGTGHGRDAARRALAAATPAECRDITRRLDAGDPMIYGMYATPTLSGQHGICYETLDLADDLGLNPADDRALTAAEDAYFTAAGEAFWAEATRIARDRAAQAAPAQEGGTR